MIRTITYVSSREATFTEKDSSIWTYEYDPVYAVKTKMIDPLGNMTQYIYDLKRDLIRIIGPAPDYAMTEYGYDDKGNMTSMKDPLGNETLYTYNSLNLVETVTNPKKDGYVAYTYYGNGNLHTVKDQMNAVTTFTYDTKGNIKTITDPRDNLVSLTFEYDPQNNDLLSVKNRLNEETVFTYDLVGNRKTSKSPMTHITNYYYNDLNQMVEVKDPREYSTYYTYDYRGNIRTVTNAKNKMTQYVYENNHLKQIINALEKTTEMTYGPATCGSGCGGAEKLASLKDALNHTTTYKYDLAGRLIEEKTSPQVRSTTYEYYENGLVKSKTNPDGRIINYVYDAAGRLRERRYPDSNNVDYFDYDQNGNLSYAANNWIAYNFTYNAANRLTGVMDSNSRGITYEYDAAGNRTTMHTPDNVTTTYVYNDAGRLATLNNDTVTFTLNYYGDGRRSQLLYPNGMTATYDYDANGNLTNLTHAAVNTVAQVVYTYDEINNRGTKTDLQTSATYAYDDISRLTGSTLNEVYTYDDVGNRLTGPQADTMTYNEGNEQLSIDATTYEYDLNGNRIKKIEGSVITHYYYDDENRLVHVSKNDGISDMIWTNTVTGQTDLWLMQADGTHTSSTLLNDLNWKVAAAGDFNGDGISDIIWTNTSTGQTDLWLMQTGGTHTSSTLLTDLNWKVASAGDFNGDGISDIIWTNTS
ncbi:hypothetical protein EG827_12435, partial [bacterium]|nr:hypothetical protein [bacterium]